MEDLSVSSPEIVSGTIETPVIPLPTSFPGATLRSSVNAPGTPYVQPVVQSNQNAINMTYNVQDDLRRYRLKRYMSQRGTVLGKIKSETFAEEGDPLVAYDIDGDNKIKRLDRQEEPDPERYYKEVRRVINLNSRFRSRVVWRPVEIEWLRATFPDLCREHWSDDHNDFCDPQKFTNCLNRLVESTEAFICKENRVCHSVALADTPSDYIFPLDFILNNIKSLGLLSTEIPNTLPTITSDNNIIIIDIVDCSGKPVEYCKEYLLPYIVVQIPPGHYKLEELAETIAEQINLSIERFTERHYKDMFQVLTDVETDAFVIKTTDEGFKFNIMLQPHPRIDALSLYYMLGFKESGNNAYDTIWSNLIASVSSNNCHLAIINKKPYRPIDLTPHKYIYLAIEGFKTIDDPLIIGYDLFAKIQLEPSETRPRMLFNTYIDNPKIFVDTPLRIIESLKISWVDAYGQLVDFQHREHSLTLEFVQYVDYLIDSNFSSLRGTRDQTSFTQSSLRRTRVN